MLHFTHLELICSSFILCHPESRAFLCSVKPRTMEAVRWLTSKRSPEGLFKASGRGHQPWTSVQCCFTWCSHREGLTLRTRVNSLSFESGRCFLGYSIACVWGNWDTGNFPFFLSSMYLRDYYSKTECCDLSPGALLSGWSVLTWVCVWLV